MAARVFNTTETLADGEMVRIRALRPNDKDGLVGLFDRLSPKSIYQRFLGPRKHLKNKDLVYLTDLDFRRKVALAATLVRDGQETIVGVARYMTAPGKEIGRPGLAIVVEDGEQLRGIGTLLLLHLLEIADAQAVKELEAEILAENDRVVAPLARLGTRVRRVTRGR
jgi:GNAT superfamily N-acetyltransferase